MPLYEYQCQECSQRVELIQKFSDPPLTECPSCRGPLQKLLFAAGIHFKGSGFYINDYARKGQPKEGGSEGGSDDSKKDESKKSEATTTSKETSGSPKNGGSSKDSSSSASTTPSTSSSTKSESKPKSSK